MRRVRFAVQSRVEVQGGLLSRGNLFGVASRLGERARKARITYVPDWPLCRTCLRRRLAGLWLAGVLFWGGLPLIVAAPMARLFVEPSGVLGAIMAGGMLMVMIAVVPFVLGSLPKVTRARTSEDGRTVIIENAAPAFVSELLGTPRA